ncbi:MAG TPA: dienelactone hydrolase family protein [Caulobacteraceae bacterium]|nr:dienelactone hydrolase family protein [Caulobacteraceae bacterium]
MGEYIKLRSKVDDAEFGAYHVQPQGRRKGGVIVLQEIFGVDEAIVRDADRWGQMGFEAVAPSLFDRQEPGFVAAHDAEGVATGRTYLQANGLENPIDDIATCLDFLAPRGPVFVVGYCYGGSLAWLAAARLGDLAAVSSYYGSMVLPHAHEVPRCPVVLHFGAEDQNIPVDKVKEFAAARPELPVHFYEAGHGFNNADGAAAHQARRRTLALFEQNGAG